MGGTLSSRLAAARKLLARRLTGRGLALAEGALATALAPQTACASAAPSLAAATARSALALAGGQATGADVIPAQVAALTEGVLRAMWTTRLKLTAVLLVAAGLIGLGTGAIVHRTRAVGPQASKGQTLGKAADRSAADRERLQGAWSVSNYDTLGRPASKAFLARNHRWTFKGDKVILSDEDGEGRRTSYTLDAGTDPKSFTLTFLEAGLPPGPRAAVPERETFMGIYRLDGDKLTICFSRRPGQRPTAFVSKADPPTDLIVLRREAGAKPPVGLGRAAKNTVAIRTTADGKVEIEVTSDRDFPAIGAFPVLHIGKAKSQVSRYPKGGRLTTLLFTMSAAEFARTNNGDRILVKYEPDSQGHWDFGKLDKGRVRKADQGVRGVTDLGAVAVGRYQGGVLFHEPGAADEPYRVEVAVPKPREGPGIKGERLAVWLLARGGKALAVKERPRGGNLVEVGSRGTTASASFLFERSAGRGELIGVVVAVDGEPKAFKLGPPLR